MARHRKTQVQLDRPFTVRKRRRFLKAIGVTGVVAAVTGGTIAVARRRKRRGGIFGRTTSESFVDRISGAIPRRLNVKQLRIRQSNIARQTSVFKRRGVSLGDVLKNVGLPRFGF